MSDPAPASDRVDDRGSADDDKGYEAALWIAVKRDDCRVSREALFSRYMVLARQIAARQLRILSRGDLELSELRQLGYAGLLQAIDGFDPSRRVPFSAYATHRIVGSIKNGIEKHSELREQLSWKRRMQRDRIRSLAPEEKPLEGKDAMAALADLAVGLALGFMLEDTGLVRDDRSAVDQPREPSAYESAAWRELVARLTDELAGLDDREQQILRGHYIEGLSFDNLVTLLGVGKSRISQLHQAALVKLRKRMATHGHFRLEQ